MGRTTIAIHTETRARIKAAAATESLTIDALLQSLLDEHEKSRFWNSLSDLTPESYAAAVQEDRDSLDQDYSLEEQLVREDELAG